MRAITITPWQPAPMVRYPSIGQTPLPMAPVPAKRAFIDSALAQAVTDGLGLTASGLSAWAFKQEKSDWQYLFYATSVFFGFKMALDLYRLNRVNT
jgi:hypothetical protein